jgi:hypothetical protein
MLPRVTLVRSLEPAIEANLIDLKHSHPYLSPKKCVDTFLYQTPTILRSCLWGMRPCGSLCESVDRPRLCVESSALLVGT